MKRNAIVCFVCLVISSLFGQTNDWENPSVISINTERPHATYIPFQDERTALKWSPSLSQFYLLLNGNWRFNWVSKPADRPKNFYKDAFDVSRWDVIPVPSDWQMHGYGYPVYINSGYPFPMNQPYIAHEHNPVGSYRRDFTLPSEWKNNEIFLHFGGVNSAFYVWINGEKVGYSQGSKTPAEFNITSFVREGKNTIAVEVYRWCDGSYLEDQDFWRLSGI